MGVLRPDLIVKSKISTSMNMERGLIMYPDIVPVIMAGIIGIYGLVVSVLISDGLKQEMALYTGFIQLGAGLSVGLAGLAAGYAVFCFRASEIPGLLSADYHGLQFRYWYRR